MRIARLLGLLAVACAPAPKPSALPSPSAEPGPPAAREQAPELEDDELPLGRLPRFARPLAYDLRLSVVPERESFSGAVAIRVALTGRRELLWMHGRGLRIKQAQATLADGRVVQARYRQMTPDGVARVDFAEAIEPQEITLSFSYDASFGRALLGLYRVEAEGRAYVFSQLEPMSARMVMPCFDEPRFKTPFDVSLEVKAEHQAVFSSAAVGQSSLAGGMKRVHFARTAPLPTYLLAFAVGELDVVDAPSIAAGEVPRDPLPLRGVTVRGKGAQMNMALSAATSLVRALEAYLGAPYPFDKLDLVAVPDLVSAGMENAGAISMREHLLLLDPKTASVGRRRGFALTLAHELAHMWLGNSVTMPWWNDLWLGESFANWLGARVAHATHPELGLDAALTEGALAAMSADALASTRQIRQPIESNHDVLNAFDTITYDKGAAVLAMFEAYLGEDVFRDIVRAHVRRFRHAVASADDFFASVAAAAGEPAAAAMRTFIEQPGVPLVGMRVSCGGGSATLELEQSRYVPLGSGAEPKQLWHIPVCVRDGGARACTLLTEPRGRLQLGSCPASVVPNAGGAGYYRAALDPPRMEALLGRLAQLTPAEALAVADGVISAFAAGHADVPASLEALRLLARAEDPRVARQPMDVLRELRDQPGEVSLASAITELARAAYAPRLERIGEAPRPGDSEAVKAFRAELLRFMVLVGRDPGVTSRAAAAGAALLKRSPPDRFDPNVVAPELVATVLMAAAASSSAAFDAVMARFTRTVEPTSRHQLLVALAHVDEPQSAAKLRTLALEPAARTDEIMALAGRFNGSREVARDTWRWLQENLDALLERLPRDRHGEVPWLAAGVCDEAEARAVEAFFAPRIDELPGGPRNLAAVLEDIELCAARAEARRPGLEAYFRRR